MADEKFGADQWLAWDVAGGSSWKALGLITGGSGPRIESGERERGGSGGMTTQLKTEGFIDYPGDVTVILTSAGSPILTNLLNTETALSFVGNLGEGVVRHDGVRPTSLEVSFGVDTPLTMNLSWLAKHRASGGPAGEVALTDQWDWEDFTGAVSIDSECYGIQQVTFKWTFSTQYSDDVCGRLATFKREHRDLVYSGLTDVSVDVEMLDPPTVGWRDDVMASTSSVTATMTNNSGKKVTITVDGLRWTGGPSRSYSARDALVTYSGTLSYRFLNATTTTVSLV